MKIHSAVFKFLYAERHKVGQEVSKWIGAFIVNADKNLCLTLLF
jgi:hypothetical protein